MGLTSKAMLKAIYGARHKEMRGILYLFPSKSDVTDFVKGRVDPLIEDNYGVFSEWLKDTNSANIKRVWNCLMYFRGMRSKTGLKCHDDQTEFLTISGWKNGKDLSESDEIATRSPTGKFMWQKPMEVHSYPHEGKLLYYKAKGLDFMVTPEHRLLLTNHQFEDEWFETAERLQANKHDHNVAVVRTSKSWCGEIPCFVGRDGSWNYVTIPGNPVHQRWPDRKKNPDRNISLRDWVAFLGLYVSEGSCNGVMSGVRRGGRVSISQMETSKHIGTIKALLQRMPFDWQYNGKVFRIGDVELAKLLFPLGNKYTKELPEWIMNLPCRYLEVLWKFALMGDGHVTEKGYRQYATVSPKLAGQFQELLQKCGRSASILVLRSYGKEPQMKDGRPVKATTPCFLVSERRSRCSTVPIPKEINYDGMVYCVSVPNGTTYTRRNGYAIWSGNSVPANWVIYDEIDEGPQDMIDMAQERMSHSTDALGNPVEAMDLKLSNPTLPDYGIDRFFQATDQRYWHIKCEACGEYTCMEEGFPTNPRDEVTCILEVGGKVIRVCKKCQSEINPSVGEWVAKHPSVEDYRGYHYSQLFSHFVDPAKILHQFRTTDNYQAFYNLKIGFAYVEAENRLSEEEVLALAGNDGISSSEPGPCSMGVDQGKQLHVVIGKRGYEKPKLAHIGIYQDWNDLDRLMKNFNVSRCVVDAMPEMKLARAFAERFPGKVFLNFYREQQRGKYAWNERDMIVSCNRTESLDASHNEVLRAGIVLPRKDIPVVKTFANHMHNVAKKIEEDDETGSKRYIYMKLGADHFRHAYNYECMARTYGATGMFGGCDLS